MYAVIQTLSFDLSIHDAFNTSQLHAHTSPRHSTIRGIVLDKKTIGKKVNGQLELENWRKLINNQIFQHKGASLNYPDNFHWK